MRMHIYSTNIPLSNDTKIVFEFQSVDSEVAFTNFVIQRRDGERKNLELFRRLSFCDVRPPPNLAR